MLKYLFFIIILIVLIAIPVMAQTEPDVPPIYSNFLNEATLAAVAAVVGFTKIVRNTIGGVKGVPAFLITVVVSFGYAFIQFGFSGEALIQSLVIGILSTGSFYLSKQVGKKTPVGNLSKALIK